MTTSDFASKRTVRCRGCNKFKRMRKPPNPVRVRHGSGANMNGERLRPRFIERVTQMTHSRAELICKNDGHAGMCAKELRLKDYKKLGHWHLLRAGRRPPGAPPDASPCLPSGGDRLFSNRIRQDLTESQQ